MNRWFRIGLVLGAALGLGAPVSAWGHGGEPTITAIHFPVARPGEVWAITDNQGLYASLGDGTAWLCEDAVAPAAGVIDVAVLDRAGRRWLILTDAGLFGTDDGGCSYAATPRDLVGETVRALSGHPTRAGEAVVVTETFGAANDIWHTADGGASWRAAGLALRGRFTALLRSEGDAERLYALHDRGGFTSGDGGRQWQAMTLGDPPALPSAVTLLAAPPGGAGRLWIAVEALPGSSVQVSDDAGVSWREAVWVGDLEMALVFDRAGVEALLITPFDGARRSDDGGASWRAEALPVDRLQRIGREPGRDRLWGSTGLFFGGPWAMAASDDFGRSWVPVLERFEAVDGRWSCPADSPAVRCCSTLCPGLPVDGVCAGQRPDDGMACGAVPGAALGPLVEVDAGGDAMVDGMVDAGADASGDAMQDAMVDGMSDALADGAVDAMVDAMVRDARLPRDARPAPADVGDPRDQGVIAPDVTVIAANPPGEGCAQSAASQGAGGGVMALMLLMLRTVRRRRSLR